MKWYTRITNISDYSFVDSVLRSDSFLENMEAKNWTCVKNGAGLLMSVTKYTICGGITYLDNKTKRVHIIPKKIKYVPLFRIVKKE